MNRVRLIAGRLLLGVLMAGLCVACGVSRSADEPQEAAFQALHAYFPQSISVSQPRPAPAGFVMLYSIGAHRDVPPPMTTNLGYVVVAQRSGVGGGWRAIATEPAQNLAVQPPGLVAYRSSSMPGGNGRALVIYGRVLPAKVAAVEGISDTGQTLRDEVTHEDDGTFLLIGSAAETVCELRLIDGSGRVLQELSPAQQRRATADPPQAAPGCS